MLFRRTPATPVNSDVTVQLEDYTLDEEERNQSSLPHPDHPANTSTSMTSYDAHLHHPTRIAFSSTHDKRTQHVRRKAPPATSGSVTTVNEKDLMLNVEGKEAIMSTQPDGLFQGEPRQSLLGRPLSVSRPNKRDVHYRRYQARIYNFLERPKNVEAIAYHLLV